MLELWATLRILSEWIIPICFILLCIFWGPITAPIRYVKKRVEEQKIKCLENFGLKKRLRPMPESCDDYEWADESMGICIPEYRLKRMSIREIKAIVEGENGRRNGVVK